MTACDQYWLLGAKQYDILLFGSVFGLVVVVGVLFAIESIQTSLAVCST